MSRPRHLTSDRAELRAALAFVADWAHDCSPSNRATPWDRQHPDEIDPYAYGFDDIEERCRAALAVTPSSAEEGRCGHPDEQKLYETAFRSTCGECGEVRFHAAIPVHGRPEEAE